MVAIEVDGVGCVVFFGLGEFSSRESIGWDSCPDRDIQRYSEELLGPGGA